MGAGTRASKPMGIRLLAVFVAALIAALTCYTPQLAVAFADATPTQSAASTSDPSSALDVPFPRVGSYWPAPFTQQQIEGNARYDYLALQRPDENAAYRALNPDIILLRYVACSELSYKASEAPDHVRNEALAEASTDWILTQVGSTLSANVNATSNTIQVTAVRDSGLDLFVAGDLVLVDEELCLVQSVGSSSITVQRGVVKPATSHAAGARIAPAFSLWPNSVSLDITDNCPEAVVDPAVGPETAREWFARRQAAVYAADDWDGLFVDRVDDSLGWAIRYGDSRSLDPDRSNTHITDDYEAFDATWREGMIAYEEELRTNVGPNAILMGNGGVTNYPTMNGNTFETFPRDNTSESTWRTVVLGPRDGGGHYLGWSAQALAPSMSSIITLEMDTWMDSNPLDDPSWTPDYAKMRFGLATTLMGDGFYAFHLATNGYGDDGTFWFDEYDNAGEGKGYLGAPLSEAYAAVSPEGSPDLLSGDGLFDTQGQLDAWNLEVASGFAASAGLDAGAVKIDVTQTDGSISGAMLTHGGIPVSAGQEYTLSFRAKADRELLVLPRLKDVDTWTTLASFNAVDLSTSWQTFEIPVEAGTSAGDASLIWSVAHETGSVWLDDVELRTGDSGSTVYRRDFEGGIALVNPGEAAQTVALGDTFRKIDGTQDPSVNDGSQVTQITLPAKDGIVLLSETPVDDPPADDPPADDPPADDPPADEPPAEEPPADDPPADDPPVEEPPADGVGCGDDGVDYDCISGSDRYATAVAISREAFPNGADTVIIATGQNWPDALGGGALAGAYDAPILLTESQILPDIVAAEVERLGAQHAIILGGTLVVQPTVEWGLRNAGITEITRYGGLSRYETAELIAKATIEKLGDEWDGTALVATGKDFPDALAGSPLASSAGWPLYLAERSDSKGLARRMREHGVTRAILLGGTSSVPKALERALSSQGVSTLRIAGDDRYSTAAAIAEFGSEEAGLDWDAPSISTGENFPDALAGGMLCAKKGSVLVLTGSRSVPDASAEVLCDNKAAITEVVYLGGTGALSAGVRSEIAGVLE